jgi:protein SCO1
MPSSLPRYCRLLACACALLCALALSACGRHDEQHWQLADVSGHLPDLTFTLTGDDGRPVDAQAFRGKVTLVYFGYTHCPDVCPDTMARLVQALGMLGAQADQVRILFISVDPERDTPALLHSYVGAFDARHAVGLTGSERQIENLARRYRVAYQKEAPGPAGDYAVTHSSGVYVFDAAGHARLLAKDSDSVTAIAADLRQLLEAPAH